MDRNKLIKTASLISISGNLLLSCAKIIFGILSGSLAVIGDGLDSLSDVFISFITLFVSMIIALPPDREHPYGHFRAETIATSILAFIIFFIGGQLSISTIEKITSHRAFIMPDITAVYVTVFSIFGKILLSWSQYAIGKKTGSSMLIANSKNMASDILTSTGVLAGLAFAYFFALPIVDKVLAILIGMWIMFTAVRIYMGTLTELMEGEENRALYDRIFDAVKKTDGTANPHRVRIRKLGAMYVIDMDVEVDGEMKVSDAHITAKNIEINIRRSITNIYDVVIHIEPLGNYEEECYGLSHGDVNPP